MNLGFLTSIGLTSIGERTGKDNNITEPWVLDKYWGKDNNISEPWVLDKYWGKDNNIISHANIAMGVSEAYIK